MIDDDASVMHKCAACDACHLFTNLRACWSGEDAIEYTQAAKLRMMKPAIVPFSTTDNIEITKTIPLYCDQSFRNVVGM